MKDAADLLRAVADLFWPIVVLIIAFAFRREFAGLLQRLRRGKLLGQEFELDKALDRLEEQARVAASEVPAHPVVDPTPPVEKGEETNQLVHRVLESAQTSPTVGLMLLSAEIEREVRGLLSSFGVIPSRRTGGLFGKLSLLRERQVLPAHVVQAMHSFWDVRNRVVHGRVASDDEVLRVIDSGIAILETLKSIPHEEHIVVHSSVEVFADPGGRELRQDVHGVVLKSIGRPDGEVKYTRIFPTSKTHFKEGMKVTWEWNPQKVWGESWYRDPAAGEIKYAWSQSMEFVGRNVEDVP